MTTQPKTTEAENPYLTREDALAILNTPDDQLDELIARAEKLQIQRRQCRNPHSDKRKKRQLLPGLCLLRTILPFISRY